MILKMAFRNLWRRKARTFITIGLIAFSYALLLFMLQFQDGSLSQMVSSGVRITHGHVIIVGKGYTTEKSIENSIATPDPIMKAVRSACNDEVFGKRVTMVANLRSVDGALMLDTLSGVEHLRERQLSRFHEKIIHGTWLSGAPGEIIIGVTAARLLKVGLGDKLQVTLADLNGEIRREGFRVKGIFKTGGITLDRGLAFVNMRQLQSVARMGDRITQVTIMGSLEGSTDLAQRLKKSLGSRQVTVQAWYEALPMLQQLVAFKKGGGYVFAFIVFFIVAAGILNSVLMSVLERTREFGVLLSLGNRPRNIFRLIMTEAGIMAFISVALGLVAGLSLSYLMLKVGLDPQKMAGDQGGIEAAGIPVTERMYPLITAWSCVWTSVIVVAITFASALFPALRAAGIEPVRALRDL